MGTKSNPGEFDCYAKAEPHEPLCTFIARDPLAADLVSLWAALRDHDWRSAGLIYAELLQEADEMTPERPAKIDEAMELAQQMRAWRFGRAFGVLAGAAAQQPCKDIAR